MVPPSRSCRPFLAERTAVGPTGLPPMLIRAADRAGALTGPGRFVVVGPGVPAPGPTLLRSAQIGTEHLRKIVGVEAAERRGALVELAPEGDPLERPVREALGQGGDEAPLRADHRELVVALEREDGREARGP